MGTWESVATWDLIDCICRMFLRSGVRLFFVFLGLHLLSICVLKLVVSEFYFPIFCVMGDVKHNKHD